MSEAPFPGTLRTYSSKAGSNIAVVSHNGSTVSDRVWHPSNGIRFRDSLPRRQVCSRTITTTIAQDTEQTFIRNAAEELQQSYSLATETKVPQSATKSITTDSTSESKEPATNTKRLSPSSANPSSVPKSDCIFKLSEELFLKAKEAAATSPESYWSHLLYRGPIQDGVERRVKVHYCRSKHTTEQVLQQYFLGKKRIGFDMEWRPQADYKAGVKPNVSLVQIACEDRIALIHIALFTDKEIDCPPTLKIILEDPEVTKIGVAIKADCTRFRRFLKVEPKSLFELSHLYKLIKYSEIKDYKQINKRLVPLAQQVEEHLQLPLFKGGDVRSSDWSQVIQMEQILYAAADAYAGLQLFETMDYKRKALIPSPPCPYHVDENKPIRLADGVDSTVDEVEDVLPAEPAVSTPTKHIKQVKVLQGATEGIQLDADFELLEERPKKAQYDTGKVDTPKGYPSPIVLTADAQVNKYRSAHTRNRANPSSLRAYFVWHDNPRLSHEDIAALLREVPLQTSTVISYILEAIRLEQLPFDKVRLKEVIELLPKHIWNRYKPLVRAVGLEQ